MATAKPLPDGHTALTPSFVLRDAARAIELSTGAFGAKEPFRMPDASGTIMHAELQSRAGRDAHGRGGAGRDGEADGAGHVAGRGMTTCA